MSPLLLSRDGGHRPGTTRLWRQPSPGLWQRGLPSQTGANPASAVAATPRGLRQERAARAPAASRRNVPCLQPTSVTPRETLQRRVTVHCLLTDAVGFLADDATCNRFSREIQTGLLPGRPAGQFWPLSPGSGSSPVGGRGETVSTESATGRTNETPVEKCPPSLTPTPEGSGTLARSHHSGRPRPVGVLFLPAGQQLGWRCQRGQWTPVLRGSRFPPYLVIHS